MSPTHSAPDPGKQAALATHATQPGVAITGTVIGADDLLDEIEYDLLILAQLALSASSGGEVRRRPRCAPRCAHGDSRSGQGDARGLQSDGGALMDDLLMDPAASGHGIVRGYAPGWAKHKFREKFGVWPNGYDLIAPKQPCLKTKNWIRSRQIAFAKRRAG